MRTKKKSPVIPELEEVSKTFPALTWRLFRRGQMEVWDAFVGKIFVGRVFRERRADHTPYTTLSTRRIRGVYVADDDPAGFALKLARLQDYSLEAGKQHVETCARDFVTAVSAHPKWTAAVQDTPSSDGRKDRPGINEARNES